MFLQFVALAAWLHPMAGGHRNADCCSGNALWFGVLLLLSSYENNPLDKVRIHDQETWWAEQNLHIEPYLLKYQLSLKKKAAVVMILRLQIMYCLAGNQNKPWHFLSPKLSHTNAQKKRLLLVTKFSATPVYLNIFFNHKKRKSKSLVTINQCTSLILLDFHCRSNL